MKSIKRFFSNYSRITCIVIGFLLIAGGLTVLIADKISTETVEYDAESALKTAQELMPDRVDLYPEERSKDYMPAMEIKGLNIAGIIDLPDQDYKAVFRSTWDADHARALPCRYTGSVYNRTLVIGAYGGTGQFDFAKRLDAGQILYITDMEGGRYRYEIKRIEHAKRISEKKLTSGDWDLTLFVKQTSGGYLLLRCRVTTASVG
ncbi:MAG: sortase [Clostridia bacterium]|nr:sortase [Clostridia bacterium]